MEKGGFSFQWGGSWGGPHTCENCHHFHANCTIREDEFDQGKNHVHLPKFSQTLESPDDVVNFNIDHELVKCLRWRWWEERWRRGNIFRWALFWISSKKVFCPFRKRSGCWWGQRISRIFFSSFFLDIRHSSAKSEKRGSSWCPNSGKERASCKCTREGKRGTHTLPLSLLNVLVWKREPDIPVKVKKKQYLEFGGGVI